MYQNANSFTEGLSDRISYHPFYHFLLTEYLMSSQESMLLLLYLCHFRFQGFQATILLQWNFEHNEMRFDIFIMMR